MQRGMDLVRQILLAIEGGQNRFGHGTAMVGSGASPEAITYDLKRLNEAGFVNVVGGWQVNDHFLIEGLRARLRMSREFGLG